MQKEGVRFRGKTINNMHAVHNLFLSLIPSHLFFFCFPPFAPATFG